MGTLDFLDDDTRIVGLRNNQIVFRNDTSNGRFIRTIFGNAQVINIVLKHIQLCFSQRQILRNRNYRRSHYFGSNRSDRKMTCGDFRTQIFIRHDSDRKISVFNDNAPYNIIGHHLRNIFHDSIL